MQISINRTTPFCPTTFIGKSWSFWHGPADGNGLEGELEEDVNARALKEIDPSKILLEAHLGPNEGWTTGDERIARLITAKRIRLDLDTFHAFWNNKASIPARFKEKTNGNTTYTFFDGQTLRSPLGERHALCFYWRGGGWRWDYKRLDSRRRVDSPSAVLAS